MQKGDSQAIRASIAYSSFRVSASTWQKLWSIPSMPKVRNSLWKALNNSLAVGENLVKRRIQNENICHMCGETNESMEYIFFKMPFC